MEIRKVCVYCASSRKVDAVYFKAAEKLGKTLSENNIEIVYGGGAVGLMGKMADAALNSGGKVVGIIPEFMFDLEWGHQKITELVVVQDMHERKTRMVEGVDAVIALPGGCGTLEELLEAITWKRLGILFTPIVIVNVNGFYDHLIQFFDRIIQENFMDERHRKMWSVVSHPEEVIAAIKSTHPWSRDARKFAAV